MRHLALKLTQDETDSLGHYLVDGKLPLEKLVSHRYELKDVNQALNDLEERRVAARALLEINP